MDNHPISPVQLGHFFQVDGKQLQQQYKHHLSDYQRWEQKEHAAQWMLFEQNIGPYLSIDETAFSSGELYTIITNKAAKGRKGSIVAMIKGAQADFLIDILKKIPKRLRTKVVEVTVDMAASLNLAIKRCFPNAHRVIDRFHVQQLAFDAVQETRIHYRWEALDQENAAYELARKSKQAYNPEVLINGDTVKQLLARSRYLLFKRPHLWTPEQRQRAELLFGRYPLIQTAYRLSNGLGDVFRICTSKEQAFKRLALWYNDVEETGLSSFDSLDQIDDKLLSIDNEKKQTLYIKTIYKTLNSLTLYAENLEHLTEYSFVAHALNDLKTELIDKYSVQDDTSPQKQINLSSASQAPYKLQWMGKSKVLVTLL